MSAAAGTSLGTLAAGGAGPGTVVMLDAWSQHDAEELSERAWREDLVLLPVRADGGTVLIGPVLHRHAPVCLGCAEDQRRTAMFGRPAAGLDRLRFGGALVPAVAGLVESIAEAALADLDAAAGRIWAVRGSDLSVSTHRALPRPGGCERCGPLPADTAEAARFTPDRRPLPDPCVLREPNPRATRAALREALYDWRFGPVSQVSRSELLSQPIASAEIVADWVVRDGGYGRATTAGQAERVAFFEAAERLAGVAPRGRRTGLVASFAELGPERALDPLSLGRYEPGADQDPTFTLSPYSPDLPTRWVWGWSHARQAPLALPEQAVYWGHRPPALAEDVHEFLFESSNGCGVGNSLEEAALYGLFELAERDAFLMAWYARTPLTPVALPTDDPYAGGLADRLESLGYQLLLFDATNDFGIPAVLAIALAEDRLSPAPQAFFTAGAHLDPRSAIRSAVVELAVNVEQAPNVARARPAYFDRERLGRLLADPFLVRHIDDHIALHTTPQARHRFEFLLGGDPARPWRDIWPGRPRAVADLGALLDELVTSVLECGVDVIVVDQSDPLVRARVGLHAARVVVPGAVPLTFAHVYRRTLGLPRLLEVPHRLGRVPEPLRYDDLPLDPHPFP